MERFDCNLEGKGGGELTSVSSYVTGGLTNQEEDRELTAKEKKNPYGV